jgi:hypothetical protein
MSYAQLYVLASPRLKDHRNDLEKWDREIIERMPGCPYLHYTRESGTHIVMMPPADSEYYPKAGEYVKYLFGMAEREHILRGCVSMAEYFVNPCNSFRGLVLHYDGRRFWEIDASKALEIAREYRDQIITIWCKLRRLREECA